MNKTSNKICTTMNTSDHRVINYSKADSLISRINFDNSERINTFDMSVYGLNELNDLMKMVGEDCESIIMDYVRDIDNYDNFRFNFTNVMNEYTLSTISFYHSADDMSTGITFINKTRDGRSCPMRFSNTYNTCPNKIEIGGEVYHDGTYMMDLGIDSPSPKYFYCAYFESESIVISGYGNCDESPNIEDFDNF